MLNARRVVVTGIGCISPVGLTTGETWSAFLAGRNGIGPVTHFDTEKLPVSIAGEATGFNPETRLSVKDARKMDRFIQLGLCAGLEAVEELHVGHGRVESRPFHALDRPDPHRRPHPALRRERQP